MESFPRNIILDLLPVYLAGEASKESREMVEKYAENDPEIARLISSGELEPRDISPKIAAPDNLEMKTIKRVRRSIRIQMMYVALATAAILMIPLAAMGLGNEVQWDLFDFIVMGILLFSTGLTFVLISRASDSTVYRVAVGVGAATGFLLIWVNLAVGIIGSENNPANFLYFGVIGIGFLGAVIARFQPKGMSTALFITALSQLLVPVAALLFWKSTLSEPPGIGGVFILNAFFAILFIASGLLFRHADKK